MSYITKNSQGPVTHKNGADFKTLSYITKNSQGPVTLLILIGKLK